MRILLVEDDERLVEALLPRLYAAGWEAEACGDGEEGWLLAQSGAYDAIALDRMLPGLDGLGLLRRIRGAGLPVPVIFITALDAVGDRVEGLDAGADDYLTKPFAAEELLARLRALARRPRGWEDDAVLRCGDLLFDPVRRLARCGEREAALSRREGALLEELLRNPGRVLPRERLLVRVWGAEVAVEEGNLDTYIHFLRRRLRLLDSGVTIETAHAVGYRIVAGEDGHAAKA
jgi:DNA-binding response OmpR family regulator